MFVVGISICFLSILCLRKFSVLFISVSSLNLIIGMYPIVKVIEEQLGLADFTLCKQITINEKMKKNEKIRITNYAILV